MIRKALMFAAVAVALIASANSSKAISPMPDCNPCPFVR
jgi:hypothetical protein